jgi:metal-dependent HD superfamily phosphatase/phosphodiesterase
MDTPRAGQSGEPPDVVLRETGETGEAVEASLEVQATETAGPVPAPPREAIRLPVRHNHLLGQLLRRVNADVELLTLWRCANINAVDRSGISDHGPVHIQVVSNIALKLARLLFASGIEPSCVRQHGLTVADAELIIVLAVLMHDIGIAIHRDEHEHFSLILAPPKIKELLDGLYGVDQRTIVLAETLHAMISHRREGHPLTVEAGIVKVADALDMTKGRSRIPFEAGQVNIHSLSALAIERVTIGRGAQKPVRVEIHMSNSAGVFQVDELLRGKLLHSGLASQIEVIARVETETEQRLIQELRF